MANGSEGCDVFGMLTAGAGWISLCENERAMASGFSIVHVPRYASLAKSVGELRFLSGSTTLPAGTVILTGTPHGVGMAQKPPRWLKAGDEVTIEIEGIGALTNPVADERQF